MDVGQAILESYSRVLESWFFLYVGLKKKLDKIICSKEVRKRKAEERKKKSSIVISILRHHEDEPYHTFYLPIRSGHYRR